MLQTIVTFLARRSVENPGISYLNILILIPDLEWSMTLSLRYSYCSPYQDKLSLIL